ncbi:MAG TPA: hypothetical protein VIG91_07000, partial [Terriglobales bacterium]
TGSGHPQNEMLSESAAREIERLDLWFSTSTRQLETGTGRPMAKEVNTSASCNEILSAERRDQKLAHTEASECEAGSVDGHQ